jgi:hypothetical protein
MLPHTRALLEAHLISDLAGCVVRYVVSPTRHWFSVARCGEFETCAEPEQLDSCLSGACDGGHIALVKFLSASATDMNQGLIAAAKLMVASGARDWNRASYSACSTSHVAIVNYIVGMSAAPCSRCGKVLH